jgi:hypothetical protein
LNLRALNDPIPHVRHAEYRRQGEQQGKNLKLLARDTNEETDKSKELVHDCTPDHAGGVCFHSIVECNVLKAAE